MIILLSLLCCGPTHFQYTRFPGEEIPSRIISVYIDKNFSEDDLINIDNSIMRWNYALNGHILMRIISIKYIFNYEDRDYVYNNHGLIIHRVDSYYEGIPKSKKGIKAIAWTDMINGHEIFIVRDQLTGEDIFSVMLHELAHYLGADHRDENGLMNRIYTPINYMCIDLGTVKQVAVANGLNANKLNYCLKNIDH